METSDFEQINTVTTKYFGPYKDIFANSFAFFIEPKKSKVILAWHIVDIRGMNSKRSNEKSLIICP